jgi:hypothetical protein
LRAMELPPDVQGSVEERQLPPPRLAGAGAAGRSSRRRFASRSHVGLQMPGEGASDSEREDWAARLVQRRMRRRVDLQQLVGLSGLGVRLLDLEDPTMARRKRSWSDMRDMLLHTLKVPPALRTASQLRLLHGFSTDFGLVRPPPCPLPPVPCRGLAG